MKAAVSCDRNVMYITMAQGKGLDDFEVIFLSFECKKEMVTVVQHDL